MSASLSSSGFSSERSYSEPRLKLYLNMATLRDLPTSSIWPGAQGVEALQILKSAGFSGVQGHDPKECQDAGMGAVAMGSILGLRQVRSLAQELKDEGYEAATLHVGTGFETDDEMTALAEEVVEASGAAGMPLFVETHRATMTQDVWRTEQLLRRVPDMRVNGDFSHYYTGQEMRYGDWEAKLEFMRPIFEATGFLHGRIGNTCCMQIDVGDGKDMPQLQGGTVDFVSDFRTLWTEAARGFLSSALPGDVLIFAPELLGSNYSRKFLNEKRELTEESDRFAQALVLCRAAEESFETAQQTISPPTLAHPSFAPANV